MNGHRHRQGNCPKAVDDTSDYFHPNRNEMGLKLSPPDLELYQRVDEVLHYVWDPIGVRQFPTARDEYHGYLSQVFSMIKRGVGEAELADHLGKITTERMGLEQRPAHDGEIARLLLEWQRTISEKFARLA